LGVVSTALCALLGCEPIAPDQTEMNCHYGDDLTMGWGMTKTAHDAEVEALAAAGSGSSMDNPVLPPGTAKTWSFESSPVFDLDENFSTEMLWGDLFCFADDTSGGYPQVAPWPDPEGCPIPHIQAIEDDGFCQDGNGSHTKAAVLRADAHNFYGGSFASWKWVDTLEDPIGAYCGGEVCEGIAIWARSETVSDKFIKVVLSDGKSMANDQESTSQVNEGECIDGVATGVVADADVGVEVTITGGDTSQSGTAGTYGLVQAEGQCGAEFYQFLQTTDQWQLHYLPFSGFTQEGKPNRSTTGVDPTQLRQLSFRFGRGDRIALWIDEIFFYRRKNVDSDR
jgi:hypothetical protein